MYIIIIFIITKELIRVTQSQLYNCYWGTVQTHCHWSGKDCSFTENDSNSALINNYSC